MRPLVAQIVLLRAQGNSVRSSGLSGHQIAGALLAHLSTVGGEVEKPNRLHPAYTHGVRTAGYDLAISSQSGIAGAFVDHQQLQVSTTHSLLTRNLRNASPAHLTRHTQGRLTECRKEAAFELTFQNRSPCGEAPLRAPARKGSKLMPSLLVPAVTLAAEAASSVG